MQYPFGNALTYPFNDVSKFTGEDVSFSKCEVICLFPCQCHLNRTTVDIVFSPKWDTYGLYL